MPLNNVEEFHFYNVKRKLFLLFNFIPFIGIVFLLTLLSLGKYYSQSYATSNIFNILIYTLVIIQIVIILLNKAIIKFFKINTHIFLYDNHIIIKSDSTFLFKEQSIQINSSDINYFKITDYVFSGKTYYVVTIKLSYLKSKYNASFYLMDKEKVFLSRLLVYLINIKKSGLNPNFHFKESWMAKKSTRKLLLIFSISIILLFFILLFSSKNKGVAFSPLISLGLLLQIFRASKSLSDLNEKIQNDEFIFEKDI